MVPGAVLAQVAEIQGYIKADGNEPVPGAAVLVHNDETGAERTAFTDETGFYSVKSLQPGLYTVTASLEGMQTVRRENVRLLVGQVLSADLSMGVEAAAEAITVTDVTPMIEQRRSSTASYITEQEIENIPVIGRDFKQYAILAPTVEDDASRGFITMSGQRGIYSGMRIDGASGKNAFFGYALGGEATENDGLTVGQDSVKEFQIIQNGFNPEYGLDGGGFVNVITKSGTNQFHGTAFYYYTDDGMSEDIERSPLDLFLDPNAQPIEPNEFERENWGLTAGGPIKRDKAHWFISYDDTERNSPFVDRLNTRGIFDAVTVRGQTDPAYLDLIAGYEPINDGLSAADCAADPRGLAACLAASGRRALGVFGRIVDNTILLGKVDLYPTQDHSVSLRYNYTDYERTSTFLDEESQKVEKTDSIIGGWVGVFGGRALNDLRFQYATDDLTRGNLRVGSPIEYELTFQASSAGNFNAGDTLGKQDFLPILADTTTFEVRENFSYLFGEHDLKFGVDYSSDNMEQLFAGAKDGDYTFQTMQQFLTNSPINAVIYFGDVSFPNYDETQDVYGAYAQDSWRPTGRLAINYGIRYGKTDNPDDLVHSLPEGRNIPDDSHWEPRIGFTYQLGEQRSSLIRGGYGVFYGRTPTLLFASQVQENGVFPNFGRVTVRPGDAAFVPPGAPIPNENPPLNTIPSTSYVDPAFEDMQNTRYNVGYEREIGTNWVGTVDVLYAEGENLQRNYNDQTVVVGYDQFGRPVFSPQRRYPNLNTLFVRRSTGESEYKAATLKINRRFTGRYTLQAHYTWSEDKDDDSNEREATDITISDPTNPLYDWGISDRDMEHRFVALATVELPLGFRVGGTAKAQSGRAWTAIEGPVPSCPTGTTRCRAQYAVIDGERVRRNTFRNDGIEQLDLRVGWAGDFGRGEIEVFGEVFNVFDDQVFTVNNLWNLGYDPNDVTAQQRPFNTGGVPNPEFGLPDIQQQFQRYYQLGVKLRL
jgi:outer membrane receptor protein involved in Fe transport